MIHSFAQASQPAESDWKFWVMAVIAVLSFVQTIVQPLVLSMVRGIKERLKEGDKQFEEHGKSVVRLETQMSGVIKDLSAQNATIAHAMQKMTEIFVEGTGSVQQLARDVERDFVRKEEIRRLEEKTDNQHAEIMRAISDLKRERK